MQTGHARDAVALIGQALVLEPGDANIHSNLGNALQANGEAEDAIERYEAALKLNPMLPETLRNLANAYLSRDLPSKAMIAIIEAQKQAPASIEITLTLGNILSELGDTSAAIECFYKVLKAQPNMPQVLCNLGNVLRQQGNVEEAVSHYEHALSIAPQYAEGHFNRGMVHHESGDIASAASSFKRAISINPSYGKAHLQLTSLSSDHGDHLEMMEQVYGNADTNSDDKMHIAFGLGKIHEDLRQYTEAFKYYRSANQLKRDAISYKLEQDLQIFQNFSATFSASFFSIHNPKVSSEDLIAQGSANKSLIFILGMPRSGTTLVEQILASHADIKGGGELQYLPKAISKHIHTLDGLDYTSSLAGIDSDTLAQNLQGIHQQYMKHIMEDIKGISGNEKYVTDKLPMNFFNIGMIHLMFPDAVIIHCRRNPIDTCLSIYKHLFPARGHYYANDLIELGQYYKAYQGLMDHWQQVLPGRLVEIEYETLISDQEGETRRLLTACRLDWDDTCLDFYETKRQISTLSAVQVRRPIYKSSVRLWQQYRNELEPLIKELEKL